MGINVKNQDLSQVDEHIHFDDEKRWIQRDNTLISILAIAYAGFHLYTGIFGVFVPTLQRTIHLLFAVVIGFLIHPLHRYSKGRIYYIIDIFLAVISFITFTYFVWKYQEISEWVTFITPFTNIDYFISILATLLLLEITRRSTGLPLVIVGIAFLVYGYLGAYMPGVLKHNGFKWAEIMEILYFGLNGVFGIPIGVSATYIVVFIIFGSFFEKTGGGQAIMDFGKCLAGRFRGGPAKVAVITSSLFGTISGSAVANVYGTGTFTIPMMKRLGYRSEFAGGVEAAASTGGQIMPPIMGAAAFIMAEFIGVPYARVAASAIIPAILYYIAIFMAVDLEAARLGLKGLSKEELPKLKDLLHQLHLLFPIVVLIWALVAGYSPMRAGVYGIITTIIVSCFQKRNRLTLSKLLEALDAAGKRTIMMAVATAVSGIVIGIVTLTGIGLNFVGLVTSMSLGIPIISLLLIMIATLILGMGVPTTVAYIIVAAIVIPALKSLGFLTLPSHMFAFYFAVIAMITPPVAAAALAAAQLANTGFFRTGFVACKLGIIAFIVPFMFIYSPELLLIGHPLSIILAVISATFGVIGLSIGNFGWYKTKLSSWTRLILVLGGLLLIKPGLLTDIGGMILIIIGILLIRRSKDKQ